MNSLKSVHTKAYTQNLNDFLKAHFLRIFPVEKEFHQSVQIMLAGAFLKSLIFSKSQMWSIRVTPILGNVVTDFPYWPENWPNLHVTFSNRDNQSQNSNQKPWSDVLAANGALKLKTPSRFGRTNINHNTVIVAFWSLKLARKGSIFTFSAISY